MHATRPALLGGERRDGFVSPLFVYALCAVAGGGLVLLGVAPGWIAAILFGLGVFHGGLDREAGRLVLPGAGYSAIYLLVAVAVFAVLLFDPAAGLAAFFALSVWHVARENEHRGTPRPAAIAEALALVGASALLRPAETLALVEAIIGEGAVALVMLLSAAGAGAILLSLWALATRPATAFPLAASIAGYALLPPLVAISAAFFALHAYPRMAAIVAEAGWGAGVRLLAFGSAAILGAAVLIVGTSLGWWSIALMAAAFLALATPHMLLDRTLREEGAAEAF
ncbi:hypothetical protein WJS89_04430 [Sphingomicrobium sp. XHP0235]|uniref:Brp/Blh family beta-carotene 15,15'-dioxygenase n=1 Tax=Sphingomicrobium aquimarinum TaxID=3133971 RepID=UPI0031FEEB2B